jgi:hypothetical protein
MDWHAKDSVMVDFRKFLLQPSSLMRNSQLLGMAKHEMTFNQALNMMMVLFSGISNIRIIESGTFGTLDFTSWEALLEITTEVDDPSLGFRQGRKGLFRGSILLWWRWDSVGKEWKGDLSLQDAEKGVKGWKIVREHHHLIPLTEAPTGAGGTTKWQE